MKTDYIYLTVKSDKLKAYQEAKELIQIAVGMLFGGMGLILGYCLLWAIVK